MMQIIWERKREQRIISLLMAFLVALSLFPVPGVQAEASGVVPEGVVILVKDEDGNAVKGARVSGTIKRTGTVSGGNSATGGTVSGNDGAGSLSFEKYTDDNGIAVILEKSAYEQGMAMTAVVSGQGYHTDDTTISGSRITASNQTFEIRLKSLPQIENITVAMLQGSYQKGKVQELITQITGRQDGDITYYSTNGTDWNSILPAQENAGEYPVYVKIVRPGYRDYLSGELRAVIEKADQEIRFTKKPDQSVSMGDADIGKKYDFTAEGGSLNSPVITYQVENASMGDTADISQIASITHDDSGNGTLTVRKGGYVIRITAAVEGNENYNNGAISHVMIVKNMETGLISFPEQQVDCLLGGSSIISDLEAGKKYADDNGKIIYEGTVEGSSVSAENVGITVEPESGVVTIADPIVLGEALKSNGGRLCLEITALKAEGTKQWEENGKTLEGQVFTSCQAGYKIVLSAEEIPDNAYILQDPEGKEIRPEDLRNGWCRTAVTVVPAEGYLVARDRMDGTYSESVTFGGMENGIIQDQGDYPRVIYLKNKDTQGVTAPITIGLDKIDSEKPYGLSIDFPGTAILGGVSYYGEAAAVTFWGYDTSSGIESFFWKYTRSHDASAGNLESDSGELAAVQDPERPGRYMAVLKIPRDEVVQLKGHLEIWASDQAGNQSDLTVNEKEFVVDTTPPVRTVKYQSKNPNGFSQIKGDKQYFSGDVEFTFDIEEANFFGEDVHITITRDGGVEEEVKVVWSETKLPDHHEARLLLSGDGDYVVRMTYTDRSGQKMDDYVSGIVVIDTEAPVIEFFYADYTNSENPQTAEIRITEHNFRPENIQVEVDARSIAGEPVDGGDLQEYLRNCDWESTGDVHRAVISSQFAEAVYTLIINYADLSNNSAVTLMTEAFIVDQTAPVVETMSVAYSTPVTEKLLSAVTFGFYNPSVTITFTAYDAVSGIDYFTWRYARAEGASTINLAEYADTRLEAVQDPRDPAKFTASVTLPGSQVEQLRGNIEFTATDRYGNTSYRVTDEGHVIVVDTISPSISVQYTTPDRTWGGKAYYKGAITAVFTVTEANFDQDDIVVMLSRNEGEAEPIQPIWEEQSSDVYVGTYTIQASGNHANDGDYVFVVAYKDKSGNAMEDYTSGVLVMDTIAPVIRVEYSNQNPVNVTADAKGRLREYFAGTRTATVTIIEHNFNPGEVQYNIIAEDVGGNALNTDALHGKSSWSANGDEHSMVITFPGDANYGIGISYTDLATLPAVDFEMDYFTVDTTGPENLKINYSTGILDTILSAVTFGFYNAGAAVTISATDNISGVHSLQYSGLSAEGVSSINAQLEDIVLQQSDLSYSDDGATAEVSFEIPGAVLGGSVQFNGTIDFNAQDRAGNESNSLQDTRRIVVDNIAPSAEVEYNAPVQQEGGVSYYDGEINALITITEANFYPEDVTVSVTRDGAEYSVAPVWSDNSTDVHTGSFTLTEDGDYFVSISYMDKSNNVMQQYASEQMTIDTEITEAAITINGEEADGKAFRNEVVLEIGFQDINLESYEILLTRTSFGSRNVDVTQRFIGNGITVSETGGSGSFDTFERIPENDGIYNITVTLADKAGHTVEKTAVFTINRYGSVYEYNDYLTALIADGGAYVQTVDQDLIITEYNADRLVSQSLRIEISRDGKPLETVDYGVTPEIGEAVSTGSSGWYQYQYTIRKENFMMDGIYKISVSSEDASGNAPENTSYEGKAILFRVDATPPEINSITGLENSVINATSVEVAYTVFDAMGLESLTAFIDGVEKEAVRDFSQDGQNYSGSLVLAESASPQTVRLVVRDLAGNITDTDAEGYTSAFSFRRSVTVSTNALVRWFANKPLFWGSIGTTAAILGAGGGGAAVLRRRRKLKMRKQA